MTQILCTSTSTNRKTGNVPQIAIGADRAQAIETCRAAKCPLLHTKYGGRGGHVRPDGTRTPLCYAIHGTVSFSLNHMGRAARRFPRKYTIDRALLHASRAARMVRIGSIGDPSAIGPELAATIRRKVHAAGMELIGYTHAWRLPFAQHWKGHIMASCETPAEADQAIDQGWAATTILPHDFTGKRFTTPAGRLGIVCPAQLNPELVTCNHCLKCKGNATTVIGFIDHSTFYQGA